MQRAVTQRLPPFDDGGFVRNVARVARQRVGEVQQPRDSFDREDARQHSREARGRALFRPPVREGAMPLIPHPEVAAKRPSKDVGQGAPAIILRGSSLRAEHLRMRAKNNAFSRCFRIRVLPPPSRNNQHEKRGRRSAERRMPSTIRAASGKRRRLPMPGAAAGCIGARSPSGARTAALVAASERRNSAQATLRANERMRALPTPSLPLKQGTLRSGRDAGGDDARTARERSHKLRPQEPHSLRDQVCLEITTLK